MTKATELLRLEGLSAGYGEAVVLHDISLRVNEGETLALLGRNGTGKTTLIDTLVGVTTQHGGTIQLGGAALHRLAPHERAAAGIGWVPQERNIFKSLTVHENLTAVARGANDTKHRAWTPERVYELFPRLAERQDNLGTQLSGGEQQMLAVGRALVLNPRLLLLDEPAAGLRHKEKQALADVLRQLQREGVSILLVEHDMDLVMQVCDKLVVMEFGTLLLEGTPKEIQESPVVRAAYLGTER